MATEAKRSPRRTLGQLKPPMIDTHRLGEIPARDSGERFDLADWETARREVRNGNAVSFLCDPSEVETASRCATEHLSRDVYDEDATYSVSMRYDARAGRLWAWLAMYSPFHLHVA